MPRFIVNFEKCAFERYSIESRQQIVSKRIHDAAVCLKFLKEGEPLPQDLKMEMFENATTINFDVELPESRQQNHHREGHSRTH
jgi:hypothetical protein